MLFRTPPPPKRRDGGQSSSAVVPYSAAEDTAAAENRETSLLLVDEEDENLLKDDITEDCLVCSYKCRQMVKSEVIRSLDMKEKEVMDLQSRMRSLEEANKEQAEQNQQLVSQMQLLERDLAAANGREKAVEDQYSKDIKQFQEWLETHMRRCKELEVKLEKEMKLRAEAETVANVANDKVMVLEEKLERTIGSSEREKSRLNRELSRIKDELELNVARVIAENEREKCRTREAKEEAELLQKQYEELKKRLSQELNQKMEMEHRVSKSTVEAQAQCSRKDENIALVKNLQEELKHYEREVVEARKLKDFHANSELLKEKILEEKNRADRAEALLQQLPDLQSKFTDMENELQSWKSLIESIPGVTSCDDVLHIFAELQKEILASTAKLSEIALQVKTLQESLDKAEQEKQELTQHIVLIKGEKDEEHDKVKRLERKASLLAKERDGLKSIISSYDEEEAIASKKQKVGDGDSVGKPVNKRIQELEAALSESQSHIKQLENDIEKQGEFIKNQRIEVESLRQKLDEALWKIKTLERDGDRLRSEVAMYESRLGHGDFNVSTTKVLRMVNTLGRDEQKEDSIESLQVEVRRLKSRLQVFEELKFQSDEGDIPGTLIPEKVTELKAQVATLQKREERYKKVFSERINVFRLACCSIFGYQVQMTEQQSPNGIPITFFTLQSIYAQNDEEKLEFEYESGNMNIKANDYTKQSEIERQVNFYIHKFRSISAFTANLTVELFNRSTMS